MWAMLASGNSVDSWLGLGGCQDRDPAIVM